MYNIERCPGQKKYPHFFLNTSITEIDKLTAGKSGVISGQMIHQLGAQVASWPKAHLIISENFNREDSEDSEDRDRVTKKTP